MKHLELVSSFVYVNGLRLRDDIVGVNNGILLTLTAKG